ncbi:hypothetical protein ACQJBY_053275 [Aegilops geniculata]
MALRLGSLPGSSMAGAKGGLAAAGAATAADRSYKSGGGERNNGVAGDAGVADVEHQWQPCSGTVINDTLLDNNSNFNPDIKMGTLRHVTRLYDRNFLSLYFYQWEKMTISCVWSWMEQGNKLAGRGWHHTGRTA